MQVAKILGQERVFWTGNGIAPSRDTTVRGGEASDNMIFTSSELGYVCSRATQYPLFIRIRRLLLGDAVGCTNYLCSDVMLNTIVDLSSAMPGKTELVKDACCLQKVLSLPPRLAILGQSSQA